ncbi:MAG: PaaI family thioesterase [Actinomycetota bacterium]|nr:PaaI family thioesterase [Actinomycetota bacterium]MDH5224300.1 PaaI family thioesterase [Actinomycetota bacterium]MDH5314624.1 PaaI family thioesterase [Actinomycetota bacterium]
MAAFDERGGDEIRERVAASPFHASMGISVEAVEKGEVELRLETRPDHANLQGTVHGGVLATLLDTAAGLAVRSAIAPGSRHVSVNLDVQYLAPAEGTVVLFATGRIVRMGRRLAFAEAEARDADGVVLAKAQVTVAVSTPPAGSEPQ